MADFDLFVHCLFHPKLISFTLIINSVYFIIAFLVCHRYTITITLTQDLSGTDMVNNHKLVLMSFKLQIKKPGHEQVRFEQEMMCNSQQSSKKKKRQEENKNYLQTRQRLEF